MDDSVVEKLEVIISNQEIIINILGIILVIVLLAIVFYLSIKLWNFLLGGI